MGKKNKKKVQKYIRKILKDGKVSKSEVRKAQNKGIRLDRISKAARRSTKPGNVFSRSSSPSPFSGGITSRGAIAQGRVTPSQVRKAPTPAAPVIRPGAQTLINRDVAARAAAAVQPQTPQTGGGTTGAGQTDGGGDAGGDDMGFDTSYYDDLIAGQDATISDLNMRIGDLTEGFQTQLGEMTAAMQEERARAAKDMREMQGNFAQAMAQRGDRTRVQGIRFADRGTGGATQAQLQRRGLRGTFGRGGERLMKISALNV